MPLLSTGSHVLRAYIAVIDFAPQILPFIAGILASCCQRRQTRSRCLYGWRAVGERADDYRLLTIRHAFCGAGRHVGRAPPRTSPDGRTGAEDLPRSTDAACACVSWSVSCAATRRPSSTMAAGRNGFHAKRKKTLFLIHRPHASLWRR